MRILIYILVLLFFITSACKKKLKTKVEGSVINFALNEPLSGAEVELRELTGTGTVSNTGFKVVETAFSDANGGIEVNHLGNSPIFVFKQDGNSQTLLQLNADGMLRARKIKVDQQVWPDYVFKKDYKLLTPYEIEAYIEENGHLPGVPSEEEILEEGLDVGEMNAILLEKIEEMTLLLIVQQKQIDALKEQQKKETVTK